MAVFCQNCGKELTEEMVFCPDCGARRPEDQNADKGIQKTGANLDRNIISRIWNSPLFTELAIRFGNVLEILEGALLIIISRFCFQESGFISKALGIFLLLGGALGCFSGVTSLISRKKSDGIPDEVDIRKSKRNLCIGVVVIIIALIVYRNIGGGTYLLVQEVTFDNWGPETVGELIDANIKSPKWSQKKLDKDSKLVYVEGYCSTYGETIQIEFYYEKMKDGTYEVTLKGMKLPESNEEFDWAETAIVWASFYNHTSGNESSIDDTVTDAVLPENSYTPIMSEHVSSDIPDDDYTVKQNDDQGNYGDQAASSTSTESTDEYSSRASLTYGEYECPSNNIGGYNIAWIQPNTDDEGGDSIMIDAHDAEDDGMPANVSGMIYEYPTGETFIVNRDGDKLFYLFIIDGKMILEAVDESYSEWITWFNGEYTLTEPFNFDEVG